MQHHPAPQMDIASISVTDSYVENDLWDIFLEINLDEDDIDSYPVYSLCGVTAEKVSAADNNFYVSDLTETKATVHLGQIRLDENGSDAVLTVTTKEISIFVQTLSALTTADKSSIIAAINEVDSHADTNAAAIGILASLTTAAKGNLVAAVNELDADIGTLSGAVGTANAVLERLLASGV